jgi:rod shape-determining protein MreC
VTVESDLQAGDLLLSTGMGGVFPPGYPVAQVSKVKRAGSTFALVEAKPTARLDQAREVLLVWFKPRVEPAAAAATAQPVPSGTPADVPATAAPAPAPAPATAPSPETVTPPAQAGGE